MAGIGQSAALLFTLMRNDRLFLDHLTFLYGQERAAHVLARLEAILEAHRRQDPGPPPTAGPLSERDAVLITYADMVRRPGDPPLQTLHAFLNRHLKGLVDGVHILPFFPYSSDDGFSVIDYRAVDPAFGDWGHVEAIARDYRLMVDAVVNHISRQSEWFQAFLRGEPPYTDYFIVVDPETDLSDVVRPRDRPLLTPVDTARGRLHLWTTFSEDQIDLNYANPQVLLEMLDLLLYYVRRGAQIIRLDAIAFLWKEIGTPCIHLPQTHRAVKLMRALLEAVAPWVLIITETNVPHEENLSYFGDGTDEAHLVYNFALPPLVLHTFQTGEASKLTAWVADLRLPSDQVTFFNFLASHDGIGLRPVEGILSPEEIQALVRRTEARGGGVSYRAVKGGRRRPYELNITYFDALTEPGEAERAPERAVARFLASQAIMLALQGLPGIYFHSLFGSRNDAEAVARTGQLRAINRQKLDLDALESDLAQASTLRARVFRGYARLLRARREQPALSPYAGQWVLDLGPGLFTLLREGGDQRLLCLHEVTGQAVAVDLRRHLGGARNRMEDVLNADWVAAEAVPLTPYQVRWLKVD